jgi:hypothetical protein
MKSQIMSIKLEIVTHFGKIWQMNCSKFDQFIGGMGFAEEKHLIKNKSLGL